MKFKNILLYAALLSGMSFSSCTDFLDEDSNPNALSPGIFWNEGGNLAASKIRNLECPSYEICLIDYGCGKFNRKIHIMEQYP